MLWKLIRIETTFQPPHGQTNKMSYANSEDSDQPFYTIFPIISLLGYFLDAQAANSVVCGPIWPKFELIHNIMHVLVTSKFEKDRVNINGDYVMTSIF